jgi:uncharacterized protein with beta-barrel porin domain
VHDFDPDSSIQAAFQAVPGANFIVNGARPARDLALVSALVGVTVARNLTASAKFDGEFGNGTRTATGTATLRYVW